MQADDTGLKIFYDDLGQVTALKTITGDVWETYTYDNAGNILSASRNGGARQDTYTYTDSTWKDLLTRFNNESIVYDEIGNPLIYRGWNMSWKSGRELASSSKTGQNISYTYDEGGIRTSKTVNGVEHKYIYDGNTLVKEQYQNTILLFFYDEQGRPESIAYSSDNGASFTNYYFLCNAKGDVKRITDAEGNILCYYVYETFGEVSFNDLSSNGIGSINPLRYRGYYYDSETDLYYLQSRYYDPEVGRFISADGIGYLGADGSPVSYNLFAYCLNDPINRTDDVGHLSIPNWLKIAVTATIVVAAVVVITTVTAGTGAAACIALGAARGALQGVVIGAVSGAVSGAACGAIRSRIENGTWEGAGKAALNGVAQGVIDGAFSGAVSGAITGGLTSNVCFAAGTAIATAIGSVVIENIRAGDYVWATNLETGEIELKEVVQLFRNETDEWIHLTVQSEEIICTPEHPFYLPAKGWTEACKLRAGDILVTVNGEYVVLEKIQHELLESPETTYNFEVEGFHTYYVGSTEVLVHNSCNHTSSWNTERRNYWKKTSQIVILDKNYGSYVATKENINRMVKGLAPKGWDGFSVQLHHWNGIANDFYNYSPVSRTLHQVIHSLR